jgi:hypothetical protein
VRWNGHVGPDGVPVFALNSTYMGLHLGVMLPVFGKTRIAEMIEDSTEWVRDNDGSHLRLVETDIDNSWYVAPPLSWLVTPVVTSVTIEYRPTPAALAREGVVVTDPVAEPPR